jgi:glycine dehydrogenase subunit 1
MTMAYIANTPDDVREMLKAIGVQSVEDLFSDIPEQVRLAEPPGPSPLSEMETLRLMNDRAKMNRPAASGYLNFIGAGAYEHFIPSAVTATALRGEFLTAYTPYQAEASQGTLQTIYEFQSMICALTGLEAANASMYDGATALAEAVLMAVRIKNKNQVLLPETLHPAYREVIVSYTRSVGIELLTWPADPKKGGGVTDSTAWPAEATDLAAVVVAHPNFFGFLEPAAEMARAAAERGALVVATANPMSFSALEPPGAWGADIAAGEVQPLGLPMNYGGPYAGYLAARKEFIRNMPGRIVGRTTDHDGREGFVLTLQTREQHIRRERATSNICTNQGLCATMATIYLSMIGKGGFEQLGRLNLDRAGRLFDRLTALKGVEPMCGEPFFNEFTIRLPIDAETFCTRMRDQGILPGLPASRQGHADANLLIVCATETKLDADLDRYIGAAEKCLK